MYLLYFILWIILTGMITLESVLFGLVIAGVILAFTCKFMDYSLKKEQKLYANAGKLLRYIGILIEEILKANLQVMHMILSDKEELDPVIVTFEADMKTSVGQALLANSITLTPGTITVLMENQEYAVHCLDASLAEGMDNSVFTEVLSELDFQTDSLN